MSTETSYWVAWKAKAISAVDVLQVADGQVAVDVAEQLSCEVDSIQAIDVRFDRTTASIVRIRDLASFQHDDAHAHIQCGLGQTSAS